MTTLSTILDTVLDETGFSKPSSYFGNTEEAAVRARTLANASVRSLLDIRHRALVVSHTINMTTATSYPLPSDLQSFVQDTMYETGDSQPAMFPTTDQQFALINASGVGEGVLTNVRIVWDASSEAAEFQIDEPKNGESLEVTYRRNTPIQATGGGAFKTRYTADTDVWLLDDGLHELDIIWRWRKLHGMDWQDDYALFEKYKRSYIARDGGYRSINLTHTPHDSKHVQGGAVADLWAE